MRTFGRVYYAVAALTLAASACLPWLVPLSYRALGFEPRLARSGTFAAFQADLATASLRREFLFVLMLLALGLVALSVVALILRVRRRSGLPWPVVALTAVGAIGVAVVALAGLQVAGGGMCC